MKYFASIVSGIVLVVVVVAIVVVGTPVDERARRFDAQRLDDLRAMQSRIVDYWEAKGNLPAELTELDDSLRGVQVPTDPESNEGYDYQVTGDLTFSLCATFNVATEEIEREEAFREPVMFPKNAIVGQGSWIHKDGQHCFDREIDPDFFDSERNDDLNMREPSHL